MSSSAIDWLWREGNTPVYIYFQRNSMQTPVNIAKSFVRQLLVSDISDPPDSLLVEAYEKFKTRSRNGPPNFPDCVDFFVTICEDFASLFKRVVVLFDAFDECDPVRHGQIVDLIQNINDSGVPVYVTTRDHLGVPFLCNELQKTDSLPIAARDDDIENYLREEIKGRHLTINDEGLKEDIIKRITKGIDGL